MHEIRAQWVVLATGAVPQALIAADMCERRTPSGVALRGYVRNPAMVGRITELEVVWHKRLSQGLRLDLSVPRTASSTSASAWRTATRRADDGRQAMADVNLREMFDRFCEVYAPARELIARRRAAGAS